ncbi:MAG: Lrp/AsnC family transcriptional regulator [Clostridia bacterium]|nr:Lrp/AsnC family transcriptional regulator [Clostridia bacterium]
MDIIDIRILNILKENARTKASAIADAIDLSISAVTERIKKLEQSGIIDKYTLSVNQKKIGNDISAVMEVSIDHPSHIDSFINFVNQTKNIISCYCVTGDYDFILKIMIDSSEGLEQLYRMVKGFEGVKATKTYIILKNIKNELTLIPEDLAD